jgi:biotin operon repressor
MQDQLPLDSYLAQFYEGEIGKKELEGFIFEFILGNYRNFYLNDWEEDECVDFLCWLYPRLSRAIDNYQYEGASFTAYIGTLVRLGSKEFRRMEIEHRLIERTYWGAAAEDMFVRNPELDYLVEFVPKKPFRPVTNPRQALILLLKSYNFISDDFIARAAPAIGMSKETLMQLIENLRAMRFEQDLEIRNLRERIYGQYFRCRSFERRRNASPEGSPRYFIMQKRLERAEKRLRNMKKALKAIKSGASNRQVARILGVSKGTIDSNIHAVKYRPEEDLKDEDI